MVGLVSQLSVAVAYPVFDGSVEAVQSTVLPDGHVITGGVVSSTVMVWTQVATLLCASVAVHVRVIVYSCGHEPGVMLSEYVTVIGGQFTVPTA